MIGQLLVTELVQPLVDCNIDTADEDAGDTTGPGNVTARPLEILKPGQIRLDDLFVDAH